MNKIDNKKLRENIRVKLEEIVNNSRIIEEKMKNIPKREGVKYRSLKPRGKEYIVNTSKGFISQYKDSEGVLYEIKINRMYN